MRTVWDRQIRPAIVLGSFIIFLFVFVGRDSTGIRSSRSYVAHPNLGHKFSRIELGRTSERDFSGGKLGLVRHLLAAGEAEQNVKGTNDPYPATRQSNFGVEPDQEPEIVSQNESIPNPSVMADEIPSCAKAKDHIGYPDSCAYVKAVPECSSGTLIEYIQLFYCLFSGNPFLAYGSLVVWLVALFYMLGNTAADFFCSPIEKLSILMHLPPTVAGVTLLPLGNGAPDVFASIAAFVGASGQGQVGLNSVLGGATFVSSVVAGSVSLAIAGSGASPVHLSRSCFLRDIGFFLFTLAILTGILFVGKIHFWGSIGYLSIYALYAFTVAAVEFIRSHRHKLPQNHPLQPLLSGVPPVDNGIASPLSDDALGDYIEIADNQPGVSSELDASLPQWSWAPHVAMFSQQSHLDRQDSPIHRPLWGGTEEQANEPVKWYSFRGLCAYAVEWPLTIPRRLTIPVVEELGWSKFYAVCSATFAPFLLAFVWEGTAGFGSAWQEYAVAASVGIALGGLSYFTLKSERPPRRYLLPWAAGGFIMSIVWFYIIANELVAALVALGVVLEIDPAILGLTVLAWGNSIGDLMANLALVYHGGHGVQIAFAGCYAGPMFNTLVGIGMSFVLASWKTYPAAFVIPGDESIYITLAFLVAGLVFALCMLPPQRMQPTKTLGIGLLILYFSFLSVRLAHALGLNGLLGTHRHR